MKKIVFFKNIDEAYTLNRYTLQRVSEHIDTLEKSDCYAYIACNKDLNNLSFSSFFFTSFFVDVQILKFDIYKSSRVTTYQYLCTIEQEKKDVLIDFIMSSKKLVTHDKYSNVFVR